MTRYNRKWWGARPPKARTKLNPANVVGIALHWPAMKLPITTTEGVRSALKAWQSYHMDGRDWSDIAYQEAIDQRGNSYQLRGLRAQSAANGDTDVNERYGALLLILGPDEEPSEAMIRTVQRRIRRHRRIFPNSRRIVGHGQIRPEPTECPGPHIQRAIDRGVFDPTPKESK